jgi:MFS transporter, DHA2 family, multidrug resistance protein
MFAVVWIVALTVIQINSRLVLTLGLATAAVACWFCSHIDSSWAGNSFQILELVLACGFACTYVGLVSSIVLEGLEAGALGSFANMATFSGFMHLVRLFGGQIGVAAMTRFITVRERFHSNLLGLHVSIGNWITDERLRLLTAGLSSGSAGSEEARQRAVGILSQQVRGQAYTMSIADAFLLIGWMVIAYLLLMLFLRPGKMSYKILRNMQ